MGWLRLLWFRHFIEQTNLVFRLINLILDSSRSLFFFQLLLLLMVASWNQLNLFNHRGLYAAMELIWLKHFHLCTIFKLSIVVYSIREFKCNIPFAVLSKFFPTSCWFRLVLNFQFQVITCQQLSKIRIVLHSKRLSTDHTIHQSSLLLLLALTQTFPCYLPCLLLDVISCRLSNHLILITSFSTTQIDLLQP